jgi:hypothetical protein
MSLLRSIKKSSKQEDSSLQLINKKNKIKKVNQKLKFKLRELMKIALLQDNISTV